LGDGAKRLRIWRGPHLDLIDACIRETVHCATCFISVRQAQTNPIDRFDYSLSLHALDVRTRFQNLPGRLNARPDQSAGRNLASPCRDVREVAPHVSDARDSVRHEQRKRQDSGFGEVDMCIPESRNQESSFTPDDAHLLERDEAAATATIRSPSITTFRRGSTDLWRGLITVTSAMTTVCNGCAAFVSSATRQTIPDLAMIDMMVVFAVAIAIPLLLVP
jgi:hypothetical protein